MSSESSIIENDTVKDHAQRQTLHEEVHARPPVALWPNERIVSQAFVLDAKTRSEQMSWINQVCSRFTIASNPIHGQAIQLIVLRETPSRLMLKWELHGEFVSITLFAQQSAPREALDREDLISKANGILAAAGAQPIWSSGGHRLVALDIVLE